MMNPKNTLVNRLRGIYHISMPGGRGMMDQPYTTVRKTTTSQIMQEAADKIEQLEKQVKRHRELVKSNRDDKVA